MSKPKMYMRIMRAAVRLAHAHGFNHFPRHQLASAARVAEGSINYNFGSFARLQDAVMAHAIKAEDLQIIAQGIVAKHPLIEDISSELRRRACNAL